LSLLGRGPKKSSGRFCPGSSDTPNTMGTVVVASLAACAVAKPPAVTITANCGEPAGPQGRGVVPSAGPAVVDRYVLALYIAGFFEALAKSAQPLGNHFGRSDLKKSDDRHRWLLAARRERPRGRRAAEQRDERASPHGGLSLAAARYHTVAPERRCASQQNRALMPQLGHSRRFRPRPQVRLPPGSRPFGTCFLGPARPSRREPPRSARLPRSRALWRVTVTRECMVCSAARDCVTSRRPTG